MPVQLESTPKPRSRFFRIAERVINGPVGEIIFACNLTLRMDELASLCDNASPRARQHVTERAKDDFPTTYNHPSAINSTVKNELGLDHIKNVNGHAV